MRRLAEQDRLTMEEAKTRALKALAKCSGRAYASQIGWSIWPKSGLRSQGLGGAASRVLKALEKDGLVRWGSDESLGLLRTGWSLTPQGRRAANRL